MDQGFSLALIEAALRIGLGLRFLYSGVSNIRRWPNPVRNAELVFPFGATFFGIVAVFLMIAGGTALTLGFHTRLAALMIALFLIPTLKIQRHWLSTLPVMIKELDDALPQERFRNKFRLLARHALHSHETGWKDNLLFLLLAAWFALRGSIVFGLDNWLE